MNVRILHCSKSLENYQICIKNQIGGFTNKSPKGGDLVYLAVKYEGKAVIGARMVLGELTDERPWPDGDRYVHARIDKEIEFCNPFEISVLAEVGGPHWGPKYCQGAKRISDLKATTLLNEVFQKYRTDSYIPIGPWLLDLEGQTEDNDDELEEEFDFAAEKIVNDTVSTVVPELELKIQGTYQAIPFFNETDEYRGLETLVNENFFSLFPFNVENTIIIPENRIFKTSGGRARGKHVAGIEGIPDCLMIVFKKRDPVPFHIYLIEYECFGEQKSRASQKSKHLNTHVIPQLIRFASAFSLITEERIRNKTVDSWVDKIINFIGQDKKLLQKVGAWIRELEPGILERAIDRRMEQVLKKGFDTNIHLMLVIDELNQEQKSTIKNVVNSFKLENGEIGFSAYVVRLVQKNSDEEADAEFALMVQ